MAGGIPQQEGVGYMKELVPAVRKLWAGDYAHDGHYWKFPLATSVPKPLQQVKAAELLGMSFRSFRYYVKKYNLR